MEKEQKNYVCSCGSVFEKPNLFNSHKNHCKIHIEKKYGSYEYYKKICTRRAKENGLKVKATNAKKRADKLSQWIKEKHLCEKCGKEMVAKYGSGRFCCKSCATARDKKPETKHKISEGLTLYNKHFLLKKKSEYEKNPKFCCVCGKTIDYEQRKNKTCSMVCKKTFLSLHAKQIRLGGPSEVSSFGKKGKYKGIHCDSTYELAFLVYCIDHKKRIKRNTQSFDYFYKGKQRKYYPDFFLADENSYIEIKGRDIGPVYEKLKAVSKLGVKIKILHFNELIPCFEHLKNKYGLSYNKGNNNFYKLYDK